MKTPSVVVYYIKVVYYGITIIIYILLLLSRYKQGNHMQGEGSNSLKQLWRPEERQFRDMQYVCSIYHFCFKNSNFEQKNSAKDGKLNPYFSHCYLIHHCPTKIVWLPELFLACFYIKKMQFILKMTFLGWNNFLGT